MVKPQVGGSLRLRLPALGRVIGVHLANPSPNPNPNTSTPEPKPMPKPKPEPNPHPNTSMPWLERPRCWPLPPAV